ncbi:MAG: phosphoglycerate kinase [Deltaproteobacteria bacterium CG11_big_fil_rev_8_21_14_0_20_47_16]|nr:MAG: phosphoglycerate kinase [Deltaproteobacteria bacterium CG11_big_fil_rev_8_21_14_0_20_47_16]
MHSITDLDISEKRVFIRVDFNVALDKKTGAIADDTRIRAALPTIQYALAHDAKVILASHLGRPKGSGFEEKYSLKPVAERLSELLPKVEVVFPEDCVGDGIRKLTHDLTPGKLMLLENLRFHAGEEKNDPAFSKELASLADIYVNDAFGTAHRAHASTVGMVQYFKEKAAGFLLQKEVDFLSQITKNPTKPYVGILGGAKITDKLPVIENLLDHVTALCIGGGMAYTFLKAKGVNVGASLVDDTKVHSATKVLRRADTKGVPIYLPVDNVVASGLESADPQTTAGTDIPAGMMGLDIGPKTIAQFTEALKSAKTVFWNGPLGVFENPNFAAGTLAIAQVLATLTDATTVVGGGDSIAAIHQAGVADKITHISTGGGASLEFVEGKSLPGIRALG